MRALHQTEYGEPSQVLRVVETAQPAASRDGVVVRVEAASLNAADWHRVYGEPKLARATIGVRRPKDNIPGSCFSGVVAEVGEDVTEYRVGDEVIGCTSDIGQGGCAELVAVPASHLAPKATGVSFADAAALPLAALTALQSLRKADVQAGQRVMVVGASGGVGSFAVQLAKWMGASVTGVCSTPKVDLVRNLGVDQVLDYRTVDYLGGDEKYDVILQLGGTRSVKDFRQAMVQKGTLMLLGGEGGGDWFGPIVRIFSGLAISPFVSQRISMVNATVTTEDMATLGELLGDGTITSVVGQVISLPEVPSAIAELKAGHTTGKTVVDVGR